MIFKLRPPRDLAKERINKIKRLKNWHKYFVWFPWIITTTNNERYFVFLSYMERKFESTPYSTVIKKFRIPLNEMDENV